MMVVVAVVLCHGSFVVWQLWQCSYGLTVVVMVVVLQQ